MSSMGLYDIVIFFLFSLIEMIIEILYSSKLSPVGGLFACGEDDAGLAVHGFEMHRVL
jgi:hypothetical protein